MPTDDDFLREINELDIAPTLLGEVMVLWAALPAAEWNDLDRRLERVVEFIGEKATGQAGPLIAMALALRLMALDAIVTDPAFRGWRAPEKTPDGVSYIHGDLLQVAAVQTLLSGPAGNPVFDREAFRDRLMNLTTVRGRA
ncbi:MAG TPA: hypothetical protein VG651_10440 [Stellaceae bacterium]|nr:hypothetical protein [Stellaceae bacterium]